MNKKQTDDVWCTFGVSCACFLTKEPSFKVFFFFVFLKRPLSIWGFQAKILRRCKDSSLQESLKLLQVEFLAPKTVSGHQVGKHCAVAP